ncbi:MAG: CCA tRNA nucleotidyltransferase [Rhodoblastus sp.]
MTSRAALAALLADPAVARALAVLDGDGEETRIVGGAVRNALIALPKTDVDMATTATPDVVMQRAKDAGLRCVPTGFEHGTVTVIVAGRPFEVTSLREDVETDGRRAKVRFGRDFDADARRRDFTINSMSLTRDGVLARSARRRSRPARAPRAFHRRRRRAHRRRLSARPALLPLSRRLWRRPARPRRDWPPPFAAAPGLERLSAERVRAEMLKLLAARRGAEVAQEAAEAGLLEIAIAGVACSSRLARLAAIETGARQRGRPHSAPRRLRNPRARRRRPPARPSAAVERRTQAPARRRRRARSIARARDAARRNAELAEFVFARGADADARRAGAGACRFGRCAERRRLARRLLPPRKHCAN